ncbi:MAG: arginine--tRNA ligase [Candidatus Bipolaricaulia bacterium]
MRARLGEALARIGQGDLVPEVFPPERPEYGDLSSNVAFALAKRLGAAPRAAAERLLPQIDGEPFAKIEVAGAGFLNFFLKPETVQGALRAILLAGEGYGTCSLGRGKRVQVEFGSANPTGPLHVGFGRNVVLGDALANLLAELGYAVEREYYVNDAGTQVENFAKSLYYYYAEALGEEPPFPFPEEGYRGEYVREWAEELAKEEGNRLLRLPLEEGLQEMKRLGLERVLESVQVDLERLGIHYDRWFYEHGLYDDGCFSSVMELLKASGYLEERAGAVWFKAKALGAEKDEVLIRSSGRPGYFASDVAYHYNKFVERGFDWVIDVWGADHQGHVPRMKAMMRALGLDPERLSILIYQLVTLKRGGEEVRLSKRTGEFVTLGELLDEVGPDAVRYFLLSRSPDSHLEFDLELAKEQSKENPVFYIQYAHTRIAGIFRELKLRVRAEAEEPPDWREVDLGPLREPEALELIKRLDEFPEIVRDAALNFAPHLLTSYAYKLAGLFHIFYDRYRVLDEAPPVVRARLALCRGTQLVLRKALRIMGVSAPERM